VGDHVSLFRLPGERRTSLLDLGAEDRRRGNTWAGQAVTPKRAERHSAVWSSLSAISEAVMTLPPEERLKQADGWLRRDPPELFYQPTPDISWESWIWQQTWTLAGRGRCYALVTHTTPNGDPLTLVPVPDEAVTWSLDRDGMWVTKVDGVVEKRWPLGRLWHVGLYVKPDLPQGMSPIAHHAESIGIGLAAQEFGARFFGDGGHPTMVFRPGKDPGPKGAEALKARVAEILSGGSREPIIVPVGTEIERWQVAPDESQFLDTMRYSGEDVARIFGVPPTKIGLAVSGQNVTYSNTADANNAWRMGGLARYTKALEAGLSRLLPGGAARQVRFNYNEFLRADLPARAAAYKTFAEIGTMSGTPVMHINEMRAEEGMRPLEGGDVFVRVQQPKPVEGRTEGEHHA
jgi:HK97 family phage portal protein